MIPKVVSDAGYTVVGLGVLAVQQVQTRRRETRTRVTGQVAATRQSLETAIDQAKARIGPLVEMLEPLQARLDPVKAKVEGPVSGALDRLPQVPRLPGVLGELVDSSRDRLRSALRPEAATDDGPPARHADQGKATPGDTTA